MAQVKESEQGVIKAAAPLMQDNIVALRSANVQLASFMTSFHVRACRRKAGRADSAKVTRDASACGPTCSDYSVSALRFALVLCCLCDGLRLFYAASCARLLEVSVPSFNSNRMLQTVHFPTLLENFTRDAESSRSALDASTPKCVSS